MMILQSPDYAHLAGHRFDKTTPIEETVRSGFCDADPHTFIYPGLFRPDACVA